MVLVCHLLRMSGVAGKPKAALGGSDALFGELSKGLAVTSGLKKVQGTLMFHGAPARSVDAGRVWLHMPKPAMVKELHAAR